MTTVSKQINKNLAHLAWSLWTELGVVGLERKHQDFIIAPEELIILTSALSEFDPRLRDEALDWCINYHRHISPIRLQILAKMNEAYIKTPFSTFTATFNALADARTKWAVLTPVTPLKLRIQSKSMLRNFDAPSMINFRIRSLLGIGAKADVLSFLLLIDREDFTASDLTETGYSKRRVAVILEDLTAAGLLSETQVRNQLRYAFIKRDQMTNLLGEMPQKMVNWQRILTILLPIRACLQDVEGSAIGVRAVDIRNLLNTLTTQLLQIQLKPPPLQSDLEKYWTSVTDWFLEITDKLANGK